jgi:hypothetical protein
MGQDRTLQGCWEGSLLTHGAVTLHVLPAWQRKQ